MTNRGPVATAIVVAAMLAASATVPAQAQTALRVSYETSDAHLKAKTVAVFRDELAKLASGKIKVETFPSSALIPSRQEVSATIRGQVEAIVPFVSYYESITPKVKALTTPLVFADYDALTKAMNGKFGKAIFADLESKGLKPLAFWYETPTYVYTSKTKVNKLEYLKGKKIRTYPSATLEKTLSALGANPAVIPGNEVYLALRNGTVDGAITTPSFAASLKLNEVLKYLIDVKLVFGGYIFALNKPFFDGLPADQRDAIVKAAANATEWNKKALQQEIDSTLATAKAAGVEVVAVPADERKRWLAAIQPVFAGLEPEVKGLVDDALAGR